MPNNPLPHPPHPPLIFNTLQSLPNKPPNSIHSYSSSHACLLSWTQTSVTNNYPTLLYSPYDTHHNIATTQVAHSHHQTTKALVILHIQVSITNPIPPYQLNYQSTQTYSMHTFVHYYLQFNTLKFQPTQSSFLHIALIVFTFSIIINTTPHHNTIIPANSLTQLSCWTSHNPPITS